MIDPDYSTGDIYDPENWGPAAYYYGADGLIGSPGSENSAIDNVPDANAGGPYTFIDNNGKSF